MIGRTLAAMIVAAGMLTACQASTHADPSVNIYENEDLSGPAYSEPVSTLVITSSAGWVCYANDRTGQDQTQYYTDCTAAKRAGAHIAPLN